MVVPFGVGVEAGGTTEVADPRDDPEIDQQIEHTVDRHPRHVGQASPDLLVDHVGRGVVLPARHGFDDGAALRGQGDGAIAAGVCQPVPHFPARRRSLVLHLG